MAEMEADGINQEVEVSNFKPHDNLKNANNHDPLEEPSNSVNTNGITNQFKKKKGPLKNEGIPRELLGLCIDMDWCRKPGEDHTNGFNINHGKGLDYYHRNKEAPKHDEIEDDSTLDLNTNKHKPKFRDDNPKSKSLVETSSKNRQELQKRNNSEPKKEESSKESGKANKTKPKPNRNSRSESPKEPKTKKDSNAEHKADSDSPEGQNKKDKKVTEAKKVGEDQKVKKLRGNLIKINKFVLDSFMALSKYPFNKETKLKSKDCIVFCKMKSNLNHTLNALENNRDKFEMSNFHLYKGLFVVDKVSESNEVTFTSVNEVNKNITSKFVKINQKSPKLNSTNLGSSLKFEESGMSCFVFENLALYWSGSSVLMCLLLKKVEEGVYTFNYKSKNDTGKSLNSKKAVRMCCNISARDPKKFKNDETVEPSPCPNKDYWCIIFEIIEDVVNPFLFRVTEPNLIRPYNSLLFKKNRTINKILRNIIMCSLNMTVPEGEEKLIDELTELKVQFCNVDKEKPQTFDNSNCLTCLLIVQFLTSNSQYYPSKPKTPSRVKSSNSYVSFKVLDILNQKPIEKDKSENKTEEKLTPKLTMTKRVMNENASTEEISEDNVEDGLFVDSIHRITRRMIKELKSSDTTPDYPDIKKVKSDNIQKRPLSNISSEDKEDEDEQPKKKKTLSQSIQAVQPAPTTQITKLERITTVVQKLVQITDIPSGFQILGYLIKYSPIDKDPMNKKGREWKYGVVKYWDPKYKSFFIHSLKEEVMKAGSEVQMFLKLLENTENKYSEAVTWIHSQAYFLVQIGEHPVFNRTRKITPTVRKNEQTEETTPICKVCNKKILLMRRDFANISNNTNFEANFDEKILLRDFIDELQTTYDCPNYLFRNPTHSTVLALRELEQIGFKRIIRILEANLDITKIILGDYRRELILLYNKTALYLCIKVIWWFRKHCNIKDSLSSKSPLNLIYWGFKCVTCGNHYHSKCLMYQHLRKTTPDLSKENVINRANKHRTFCKNFRVATSMRTSYYSNENLYDTTDFKMDIDNDFGKTYLGDITDEEVESWLNESETDEEYVVKTKTRNSQLEDNNMKITKNENGEKEDLKEHYVYYPFLDSTVDHNEWNCPECRTCMYCCEPIRGRSYISRLNYCFGCADTSMKSYKQFPPCFEQKVDQLQRNCLQTEKVKDVVCVSCSTSAHRSCCYPMVPNLLFIESWKCDYCTQCISCGYRDITCADYLNWGLFFFFCLKCWELLERSNYCGICYKVWTNFDTSSQKWVQCEGCKLWIHIECDDLARLITDCPSSRNQNYRCLICRSEDKMFRCTKALEQIFIVDKLNQFRYPVSPTFVTYWRLVTKPMNLVTLFTKLESGKYKSVYEFIFDVFLIPYNAKMVNMPNTKIYKFAIIFERKCRQIVSSIMQITDSEITMIMDNGTSGGNVISREKKLMTTESPEQVQTDMIQEVSELEKEAEEEPVVAIRSEKMPEAVGKQEGQKMTNTFSELKRKVVKFNLTFEYLLSCILNMDVNLQDNSDNNTCMDMTAMRNILPQFGSASYEGVPPISFTEISKLLHPHVPCGLVFSVVSVASVVAPKFMFPPTFSSSEDFEKLVKSKKLIMLNKNKSKNPYLLSLIKCRGKKLGEFYLDTQEQLDQMSKILFKCGFIKELDACVICGSTAFQSYLMYCENCAEPMHYYCAGYIFPPGYLKYNKLKCALCSKCERCELEIQSNHPYELSNVMDYKFGEALGLIPTVITNIVLHSAQVIADAANTMMAQTNQNKENYEFHNLAMKYGTFLDGRFMVTHTGHISMNLEKELQEKIYHPLNSVKCVSCGKSTHLNCIRIVRPPKPNVLDKLNENNPGESGDSNNGNFIGGRAEHDPTYTYGTEEQDPESRYGHGEQDPNHYLETMKCIRNNLKSIEMRLKQGLLDSENANVVKVGEEHKRNDSNTNHLRTALRNLSVCMDIMKNLNVHVSAEKLEDSVKDHSKDSKPQIDPKHNNLSNYYQKKFFDRKIVSGGFDTANTTHYSSKVALKNTAKESLSDYYSTYVPREDENMYYTGTTVPLYNQFDNRVRNHWEVGNSNEGQKMGFTFEGMATYEDLSTTLGEDKGFTNVDLRRLSDSLLNPVEENRITEPRTVSECTNSSFFSYAEILKAFEENTQEEQSKKEEEDVDIDEFNLPLNLGWEFDGSGVFSCSKNCSKKYHNLNNLRFPQESLYSNSLLKQFDALQEYYKLMEVDPVTPKYHLKKIKSNFNFDDDFEDRLNGSEGLSEVRVTNRCIMCGKLVKNIISTENKEEQDGTSEVVMYSLPQTTGVWALCVACEAYSKYLENLCKEVSGTKGEKTVKMEKVGNMALDTMTSNDFLSIIESARNWILTSQHSINYITTVLDALCPNMFENIVLRGIVYDFLIDGDHSEIYPHLYNTFIKSPMTPVLFTESKDSLMKHQVSNSSSDTDLKNNMVIEMNNELSEKTEDALVESKTDGVELALEPYSGVEEEKMDKKKILSKTSYQVMISKYTQYVVRSTRFFGVYKELLSYKVLLRKLGFLGESNVYYEYSAKAAEFLSTKLKKLFHQVINGEVQRDEVSGRLNQKYPYMRKHLAYLIFNGDINLYKGLKTGENFDKFTDYVNLEKSTTSPAWFLGKIGYEAEGILKLLQEFVKFANISAKKNRELPVKRNNFYKKLFMQQKPFQNRMGTSEATKSNEDLFYSEFAKKSSSQLTITNLCDSLKVAMEKLSSESKMEDLEDYLTKLIGSSYLVDLVSSRAITGDLVIKEVMDSDKFYTEFTDSEDKVIKPPLSNHLRSKQQNMYSASHYSRNVRNQEQKRLESCCLCGVGENTLLRGCLVPWRNGFIHSECILWSLKDVYCPRTYNYNYDNLYTLFEFSENSQMENAYKKKNNIVPAVNFQQPKYADETGSEGSENSEDQGVLDLDDETEDSRRQSEFDDNGTEYIDESDKDEIVVQSAQSGVTVGNAKSETIEQGSKPDATVETGKPDATVETGKPDATVETGKPDVTVETGKPDATVETGKLDVRVETDKAEPVVETGKPEVTSGPVKTDHPVVNTVRFQDDQNKPMVTFAPTNVTNGFVKPELTFGSGETREDGNARVEGVEVDDENRVFAERVPEQANINLMYMPVLPPVHVPDSLVEMIYKASRLTTCQWCNMKGATVTCAGYNCKISFHLCCALVASSKLVHSMLERDNPEDEFQVKVFPIKMFYTRRKVWCAACFEFITENVKSYHIKSLMNQKKSDIKSFLCLEGLSPNAARIVFRQTLQSVRIVPRTLDYKKLEIFMSWTSSTYKIVKSAYNQTMYNHQLEPEVSNFISDIFKPDPLPDSPNKINTDYDYKNKYFLYGSDKHATSVFSVKVPFLWYDEAVTHNLWRIGTLAIINIGDALMQDRSGTLYPIGFTSVKRFWNTNYFRQKNEEAQANLNYFERQKKYFTNSHAPDDTAGCSNGLTGNHKSCLDQLFLNHNSSFNTAFDHRKHMGHATRSYYLFCIRSLGGEPFFTIDLISDPNSQYPNLRLCQGRDLTKTYNAFKDIINARTLDIPPETFFGLNLHIVLQQIRFDLCCTTMHRTTQFCKIAAFKQSVLGSRYFLHNPIFYNIFTVFY
eukprot:XP_764441.1 hypothetical protein [Theileria parva strain Muguga]